MIYLLKPNRVRRTYLGGMRIERLRGDVEPRNSYYPEEWVASITPAYSADSTNPEGLSRISDGRTLRELIESDPALIGAGSVSYIGRMYPILLKLLDADERLVIQAHPTAEFAR